MGGSPRILVTFGFALLATAVASTDTRTAPIMLQLGDLLFSEGKYSEARKAYEVAQDTEDDSIRRSGIMGMIRTSLRLGDFTPAMATARELRENVPDDALVQAIYGDALWASGLFEEAVGARLRRDPRVRAGPGAGTSRARTDAGRDESAGRRA